MPLDFLKRKATVEPVAAPAAPPPPPSLAMPEEVVAQEHQLKLYYAGKSSGGVRMKAGRATVAQLPPMLAGLALTEVEVVEPLPIEFSQAAPTIVTPSQAMQNVNVWWNASSWFVVTSRSVSARAEAIASSMDVLSERTKFLTPLVTVLTRFNRTR